MNQKEFVQKTDAVLDNMNAEELRSCLHNIARKTPESKRNEFMQMLEDCLDLKDHKGSCEKFQYAKSMQDDEVKVRLAEIKEAFEQIEDGELSLSAQGYEDYSAGYWADDWIWEYEDPEGIGKVIEEAALFAGDCVNDCRYEEAVIVFNLIISIQVLAEDGGDPFELGLEEMVAEKLVEINLKTLALNVLYSEYQLQPAENRARALFAYFAYPYFEKIHIEDIFSMGREELKDSTLFWQLWTDFLMQQSGETAARLVREAILYHKGTEGLAEMAKQGGHKHPSIYLAALSEYENVHDYEKMKEIGTEALDRLDKDLIIRSEIALKTAQAAFCTGDREFMKNCWYEAFYSNSTVPHYLRLFTDGDMAGQPNEAKISAASLHGADGRKFSTAEAFLHMNYKDLAEKRLEELRISDRYYSQWSQYNQYSQSVSETAKNQVGKIEYRYLSFFSGYFNKIVEWCKEQKNPLGWTGMFIGHGIDLLLLYLYAGCDLGKAGKRIAARTAYNAGFGQSKNLVFMKENLVFEAETADQKGEEVFWKVFCLWKENYPSPSEDVHSWIKWLEDVIGKRIDAILGGQHRGTYEDVALLAAALGEVKESQGIKGAKKITISKYLKRYPRHRSFQSALKEYLD